MFKSAKTTSLTTLFCLLATTLSAAETVDDFTVMQGPIAVGPGEEPSEDEASRLISGVLGGFRVLGPAVDDDAPAGTLAEAEIGGGEFRCSVEIPSPSDESVGGCTTLYADRNDGVFDITEAEAFEFEVLEAPSGTDIVITLVPSGSDDALGNLGFIEDVTPGSYSLPIDEFQSINFLTEFDPTAVARVLFTVVSSQQGGTTRVGALSTRGPIGGGSGGNPDDPGNRIESGDIAGTYYDPLRDGEGCQVTLEGDESTVVLTCYMFLDGEQIWLISVGSLSDGEVLFSEITITSGADWGAQFQADDVLREVFGMGKMIWEDCNNATLTLEPALPRFEDITLDFTKITPIPCDVTPRALADKPYEGTMFDPQRDGEGFQLVAQGTSDVYALSFYTYLNGAQAWLIGVGTLDGDRMVFEDLIITRGTGFGSDFDPADVIRETWGDITLEFSDCNNAMMTVAPAGSQTAFTPFATEVQKVVPGTCP